MSDYLWDKTGEPEEDVARLEELLGTLRYEPRPLVLPAAIGAQAPRRKFRPPRSHKRQWLALAASLLLMLLAGAWALKWQHDKSVHHEVALKPDNESTPRAPALNDKAAPEAPTTSPTVAKAQSAPAPLRALTPVNAPPPERVNYHVVSAPRHARSFKPIRREQLARSQHDENATLTAQQKQATEQLLLALRITSAKLNYAERQVQELSAARKPETR